MSGPVHIYREELNSLGFAKAPAKTRVVVAMSGGSGQFCNCSNAG